MSGPITVVQYWGGCPKTVHSKYQAHLAICKRCYREGWRNYLLCHKPPEDASLLKPFADVGCEVIVQPRSLRSFDVVTIGRTCRLLRRLACTVFHCDNDHTSPLIGAALAGVPVRIWSKLAMSPYYERGTQPKGLHRLMPSTRVSCLCAHRVLAISDRVRQEVIDSVGFGERIQTVPLPIDAPRFANAPKGEIRRELEIDPLSVLITSTGHAVPVKGWDVAIRAFVQIHRHLPKAHLALIGGTQAGAERQFFQDLTLLARNTEASDNIHFLGHRSDIGGILKASDVFILPSRSEGMPAALLEAMAAGLPCVAANVGGIPEVIEHGKDALLFERENAKELANGVVQLITDKGLRERIASRASRRAHAFSMESYLERIFECYTTLLAQASIEVLSSHDYRGLIAEYEKRENG